jgi:hypothetical protein
MDMKHHHFHLEAYFFYENATGTGDVIKIECEGTHEGKKGEYKNANTPPAEGKNGKFIGKYPRGTKIVANSLDNREICFKYTCNGPIKTKYFLYNV